MSALTSSCRALVCVGLALAAHGCTRTYDGSIVPAYRTAVVYAGPVPLLGVRRTRVEPGNTAYDFPSAPPRPRYAETTPAPAAHTSTRRRATPRPAPSAYRPTVRCRDAVSTAGRVRVDCQ